MVNIINNIKNNIIENTSWFDKLMLAVIALSVAIGILILLFAIIGSFIYKASLSRKISKCRKYKDNKGYCVYLAWRMLIMTGFERICEKDDKSFLEFVKNCVNLAEEPIYEAAIEIISFGRLEEDLLGLWSFRFPESVKMVAENYGARTKGRVLRIEKFSRKGDVEHINLVFNGTASSDSDMSLDESVVDAESSDILASDREPSDIPVSDGESSDIPKLENESKSSDRTIWDRVRSVLAFALGFIFATVFARDIAFRITNGTHKFLFMGSLTANKIAVWLLIFASVVMIIGKFNKTKAVGNVCGICSGMGLFVLYVQYCRSVEAMKHYIIFSVVLFIVFFILIGIFQEGTWYCSLYLYNVSFTLIFYPLLFLIYIFLCKLIRLPGSFCLVLTSIVMLFMSFVFALDFEASDTSVSDGDSGNVN